MSENELAEFFGNEFSDGARAGGFLKTVRPLDNASIEVGVLTQMGENRNDPNGWRVFHKVHWGYTVPNEKDPSKPIRIRFVCTQKWGSNKMIIKDCPACVRRDKEFEAKEAYEAKLKLQNKSEDEIKSLTSSSNSWLRQFNRDSKWVMYAYTGSEFVRLMLSHKTFQVLEKAMNAAQNELQLNPRSPKNLLVWKITRTGSAKSVGSMSEQVERMQEAVTINGRTLFDVKLLKLSDDQLRQAINSYVDLKDIGAYTLTDEQIQALVDCDEEPESVARIVGAKPATKATTAAAGNGFRAPALTPVPTVHKDPGNEDPFAASPAAATPGAYGGQAIDDEEEQLLKQLESARAKKTAAAAAKSAPTPVNGTPVNGTPVNGVINVHKAESVNNPGTASSFAEMSDDELFTSLGLDSKDVGDKPPAEQLADEARAAVARSDSK